MENCHPSIPLYNSVLQMVGSEDEIGMKRTETDIYDHIYNQMCNVLMKRITAGSTKEGLRFRYRFLLLPDKPSLCVGLGRSTEI